MPDNVLDLDILRPKAVVVKLAGKKIDVSFIPVGITFEVDEIVNQLGKFKQTDLEKGGEPARKAIELTIKLCALFCAVRNPELNEEWFKNNASPAQMTALANVIKDTLLSSYEGIEAYRKN